VQKLNQVFRVKREEIERLKGLLFSRSDIEQLKISNQYEAFRAKYDDYLIIGYKTGKIVATKEDAKNLMLEVLPRLVREPAKKIIIGSDEAGKGEWLGPIVVAAVALNQEQSYELQAQGVMDSKELTLPKIEMLADFIRRHNYPFTQLIITPKRFNKLYDELKSERKTLNSLLAWGHSRVIERLFKYLHKDPKDVKVIIDEFDRIKTEKHLRVVLDISKIEVIQQPRAEEHVAVAAASIIARDVREDYIDFLCRKLSNDLRTLTVEQAIADEKVPEYAKVSFLKRLLATKYGIAFR
jgi:ribonuclease HIII